MKKIKQTLLLVSFTMIFFTPARAQSDSLVKFSDLKYQSQFEKEAIHNFVQHKRDTFNLFLAIDKNMSSEEAVKYKTRYENLLHVLETKRVQDINSEKKIRRIYPIIHNMFLEKFHKFEYFPAIFQTGKYNCLAGSILYAQVFEHFKIPFKVQVSQSHVYLVANPGKNPIVVEATSPSVEQMMFWGEYKSHFVDSLRNLNQISNSEWENKSTEELFQENFKQVRNAGFNNLIGLQYINKAVIQSKNNDLSGAVSSFQKAYFFDPNKKLQILLYYNLLKLARRCKFNKVSDIDYLAQLSRFKLADTNSFPRFFGKIIQDHLQHKNKEAFCDSLDKRLNAEISDKGVLNKFNYEYDLQMSYHYQHSDKVERFVVGVLARNGNQRDARTMMANYLNRKLFKLSNPDTLLDTIRQLKLRLHSEVATRVLLNYKLYAYLQKATYAFAGNHLDEGNKYLTMFEKECKAPVKSKMLLDMIHRTYNAIAQYYLIIGDKSKAKLLVHRESKYILSCRMPGLP